MKKVVPRNRVGIEGLRQVKKREGFEAGARLGKGLRQVKIESRSRMENGG